MLHKILNPLNQFDIFPVYSCGTSNFLNVLFLHLFILLIFFKLLSYNTIKNSIFYSIAYSFIMLLKDTFSKNSKLKTSIYIPLYLYLFIVILLCNWLSMIPYSYAITSILSFNLFLVLTFFGGLNLIGIIYQKWNFFNVFAPKGIPVLGLPPLIFFETISYFARIVSLSVRLFANILSVHILQHILISFSYKLFLFPNWYFFIFLFPWIITFCITFLEFMISLLQAQIIIILLCIYKSNAITGH